MIKNLFYILSIVISILLVGNCGFHQTKSDDTGEETQTASTKQADNSSETSTKPSTVISPYSENHYSSNIGTPIINGEKVPFDISLVDEREVSLQLVQTIDTPEPITPWSINVYDCASTYAPSFNHLSSEFFLYRGDQNCVAGLVSFTMDSLDWTKLGGGPCSGPAGFTCAFESGGSNVSVSITAQLNSGGITDDEEVTFLVTELKQNSDENMTDSEVSDKDSSYEVVQGSRATYVDNLFYSHFDSVDTNGRGTFTFRVECKDVIYKGHATDRTQWNCHSALGQFMTDYDICLVNADGHTLPLDADGADTLFDNCLAEKLDIAAANIKDDTDVGWAGMNGGIEFTLQGPLDMYANTEMIVIISYYFSYRYWKLTVDDM